MSVVWKKKRVLQVPTVYIRNSTCWYVTSAQFVNRYSCQIKIFAHIYGVDLARNLFLYGNEHIESKRETMKGGNPMILSQQ